ncbi:MAG: hypothetical protein ACOC3T_00345 [Bacteroidota bacterium]
MAGGFRQSRLLSTASHSLNCSTLAVPHAIGSHFIVRLHRGDGHNSLSIYHSRPNPRARPNVNGLHFRNRSLNQAKQAVQH